MKGFLPALVMTLVTTGVTAGAAIAAPAISIDNDTPSFENRELVEGPIKVRVRYQKSEVATPDQNLHYSLFYEDKLYFQGRDSTYLTGRISLQDLDRNQIPEVIIKTYSGGAHCCTNLWVYSWTGQQFHEAELGALDGDGGQFTDLNGDGQVEFLTVDNAFLYLFASYADSFPPSRIYRWQPTKLENVTRNYPQALKARAWRMYQAWLEARKENRPVNGILAGYVAQKALLGEFQRSWQFMQTHYDHTSQTGLEIYRGDRKMGQYPNFPAALKAYLLEWGYITAQEAAIVRP